MCLVSKVVQKALGSLLASTTPSRLNYFHNNSAGAPQIHMISSSCVYRKRLPKALLMAVRNPMSLLTGVSGCNDGLSHPSFRVLGKVGCPQEWVHGGARHPRQ